MGGGGGGGGVIEKELERGTEIKYANKKYLKLYFKKNCRIADTTVCLDVQCT